jgi:plastocyanin
VTGRWPYPVWLLALAAAALVNAPASEAAVAPRVHTVIIDKLKFGPVPHNIRSGDTIVWVNRDLFKHTATARDKSFNVQLAPGTSGRTLIKHPGTIAFYCIYHPGMTGSLVVAR